MAECSSQKIPAFHQLLVVQLISRSSPLRILQAWILLHQRQKTEKEQKGLRRKKRMIKAGMKKKRTDFVKTVESEMEHPQPACR